jgi:DNA-binding beta-propeller fold protein YncE
MGKSWAAPDAATGTLLYTCDVDAGTCEWFKVGRNTVVGMITGLTHPVGIAVDKSGNVFIADRSGHVFEYAKGGTTLLKTFDDPGFNPEDVAVDSDGTLYVVANLSGGVGHVAVYSGGSTTPTRIINDPLFHTVLSVAVDENHLLIACYQDPSNVGNCDEFAGGKGPGRKVIRGLGFASGVSFDNAENIVVDDGLNSSTNVYKGTTFARCNTINQTAFPFHNSVDKTNGDLFYADPANGALYEETFGDCVGIGSFELTYDQGIRVNESGAATVDPGQTP